MTILFSVTSNDFVELDERPGQFGLSVSEWHPRLRWTRNADTNLFGALAATRSGDA